LELNIRHSNLGGEAANIMDVIYHICYQMVVVTTALTVNSEHQLMNDENMLIE